MNEEPISEAERKMQFLYFETMVMRVLFVLFYF